MRDGEQLVSGDGFVRKQRERGHRNGADFAEADRLETDVHAVCQEHGVDARGVFGAVDDVQDSAVAGAPTAERNALWPSRSGAQLTNGDCDAVQHVIVAAGNRIRVFIGARTDAQIVDDERALNTRVLEGRLHYRGSAVEVHEQVIRFRDGATTRSQRDHAATWRDTAPRGIQRRIERLHGLREAQTECVIQITTGGAGETRMQHLSLARTGPEPRADFADDEEVSEDERCQYPHASIFIRFGVRACKACFMHLQ